MGMFRGRGSAVAALGVALAVAAPPSGVRAAIFDDSQSAVTLPSGNLSTEAISIRKVLEVYVRAVEAKDMQMFRAVKPNLSEEEEKRARTAFKSIQSQVLPIVISSFVLDFTINFSFVNAAGVLAIVPPVILAIVFERYIVSGLTAGAVKG